MKTKLFIIMLLTTGIMFSQKTKNGTVYKEHPAITATEAMWQAFFSGDKEKAASYLADDFRSFSGTPLNKDAKGGDKENFLGGVDWVKENMSYVSYTRSEGAYPDAIEYKEDEDGLWVQSWDHLKAMNNQSGVKIDMPIHRLYQMNDDSKIYRMYTYDNDLPWLEMRRSNATRTNGTIYVNHDNINTVRKMVGGLEHGDVDKAFSYFTEDARFSNLDMKRDESNSVEEEKAGFTEFLKNYTIESIDVVGYPDYLEYELANAKVVQSWWDMRVTRKSDGKKFVIPAMLTHNFNDEGKITRELGYYTMSGLGAK